LGEWDSKSQTSVKGSTQAFQYFPERVTDNKAVNWASREIPGGSHPIYSFISGGERSVAFDAIFTDDTGDDSSLLDKFSLTGFGNPLSGSRKDTVDVAAAIAWLRKYLYPKYNKSGISAPPPLVIVYFPNSNLVSGDGIPGSLVGFINRADVTYEAFHRNGKPRIAVVNVEIKEVVQISAQWKFHGFDDVEKSTAKYTKATVGVKEDAAKSVASIGGGGNLTTRFV
jgi:hypothetical protein